MPKVQLHQAVLTFIRSKDKETTRKAYHADLDPMTAALGPSRLLSRITTYDLIEYVNDHILDSDWAHATKHRRIKGMKAFWRWAWLKAKLITSNPADGVDQLPRNHEINVDKAMTEEELSLLLDFAKYQPMLRALLLFLAEGAGRRGGAHTLKLSDLHLEDGFAYVDEKGDKRREVFLTDKAVQALRHWLLIRGERPHEFVFCHAKGPYKEPEAISQLIARACQKLGIRELRAHSIRHRAGFLMAQSGISESIAAKYLGNSAEVTRRHYFHIERRTVQELAPLLTPHQVKEDHPHIESFQERKRRSG